MKTNICKLTIKPDNKSIELEKGANLLEAITKAGIQITSPCGGEGTCGKCRVIIESDTGLSPLNDLEKSVLKNEQIKNRSRLACQAELTGNAVISIPEPSRVSDMQILLSGAAKPFKLNPSIYKTFVHLPKQNLENAVSAYAQLKSQLDGKIHHKSSIKVLRDLAIGLNKSDGNLTPVFCNNRIISIESGNTVDKCYGMALDIGTTTIVGALIDLQNGEDLAFASVSNPQSKYGHDVISRINLTIEKTDGLQILQSLAIEAVNQVIDKLVQSAKIPSENIYEMTVVGNSTMYHLLLGISPRSLGLMPYIPVVSDAVSLQASELGIKINPNGNIYVLPNIAGFLGADTVGAILAAGLENNSDGKTQMLADIGTNCEIVLKKNDEMIACSTAAGPAFEGAKIKHGIYAGPGAIEKIVLNDDCEYKVIGNKNPTGICGSAVVDIGAELLKTGIVDMRGKMLPAEELDNKVKPNLKKRIIHGDDGLEFVIAQSETGENITMTQRDIRELQLGKAAIRTGIEVLLDKVDIKLEQIDELLIAGGFGNYINKENAIRLGMIPKLPTEKIKFIGNAAIVGAKMALLSREARESANKISKSTKHIQVAETPDFQMKFMESMLFD